MTLPRPRRPLLLVVLAYAAVLAGLRASGRLPDTSPPECLGRFLRASSVRLQGLCVSPLRSGPMGASFLLETARVEGRECRAIVLARLPKDAAAPSVLPGSLWDVEGRLRGARAPRDPGGYDERAVLGARGAVAIVSARLVRARPGPQSWRWRAWAWAAQVKGLLAELFSRLCTEEQAAVLDAVVLGDKALLDPALRRALRDAGAVHLIVPSGTNVGFLFAFVFYLGAALGLARPWRLGLGLVGAGFYGLMVGFEPPFARAYLCAAFMAAAWALDRDADELQLLALAALLQLLVEPRDLFQPGFRMSYLAVAALLFSEPLRRLPEAWPRPLRAVGSALLISVIAVLALAPELAALSGKVPALGVLANVLLVPLSGALLAAGFALGALSCLPAPDWLLRVAALVPGAMADAFRWICLFCAGLPGATVPLARMSGVAAAGYYLVLGGLLLARSGRVKCLAAVLGLGLFSAAAVWARLTRPQLSALCLSQPGPCLVSFADGRSWLVGAEGGSTRVLALLRERGVRRLARVIILGGRRALPRLCAEIDVERVAVWKGRAPFSLWAGVDRFEFGGAQGLRVFRGEAEYLVVPVLLRQRAVEVAARGGRIAVSAWGKTP